MESEIMLCNKVMIKPDKTAQNSHNLREASHKSSREYWQIAFVADGGAAWP